MVLIIICVHVNDSIAHIQIPVFKFKECQIKLMSKIITAILFIFKWKYKILVSYIVTFPKL